ncbi:MAG: hypothetical protein ACP5I4_09580 [Oceanipulchritudo sp.]
MNPDNHEYTEEDRKFYLALQKAGLAIPIDLEEALQDPDEPVELPDSLKDVDRAVKLILSGDLLKENDLIMFPSETSQPPESKDEFRMAARHGGDLSEETRAKLRKLREKSD